MRMLVSLAAAAAVFSLSLGAAWAPDARADHTGFVVLDNPTQEELDALVAGWDGSWDTEPDSNLIQFAYWSHSFNPTSPANVATQINDAFATNISSDDMVYSCEEDGCDTFENASDDKGATVDLGELSAFIFGVKIGGQGGGSFLAFLFDPAVSWFQISGLSRDVSNIHAYIPLPAGLILFLSGLAGIGVLGRYKAKRQDVAIA